MKFAPVVLAPDACKSVDQAIRQTADKRRWPLHALNVRTNHVHVVAMCDGAPERMLNDLKAYATRRLRAEKVIAPDQPVWTDGGSTRYLWNPVHVRRAVYYVLHCQGSDLFDRDSEMWDAPSEPIP